MLHRTVTLAAAFALAATAVWAETEIADKATGAVYILGPGENGALTLANKLDGAMDTYNLYADCQASHPLYGVGKWHVIDGGWGLIMSGTPTVSFDGALPFPEADCPA